LEDTPTSTIRGVAMGMAELVGKAEERTPVLSALSQTPCVWWRFLIEEEQSGSKGERRWVKVQDGTSHDMFYLNDGTGRLVVDPIGAEMRIDFKRRWLGAGLSLDLVARGFPVGLVLSRGGGQRRYTEWLILPTGKLYVFGTVKGVRDAAAERRERLTQALRDLKADRARMSAFDADRDGNISAEEWETAVEAMKRKIAEDELGEVSPAGAEDADSKMVCKGTDEKTYVISDTGEGGAVGPLAWTGYPSLLLGIVLGLGGLASLLARTGAIAGGKAIPWGHFLQ